MNKSSQSYQIYLDKSEAHTSGVMSQPERRAGLPPVEAVKEAVEAPGTCLRLCKQQTGENRAAINSYVEKCHESGPNN